jgi:hypothetical protein
MRTLLFSLLIVLGTPPCWAATDADRSQLAAYGIAYCISKIGTEPLKTEADLAMGGFVQLSRYENEEAYRSVRRHVDELILTPLPVYQTTGKTATLMICLDMGHNPNFLKTVRKQDLHLPTPTSRHR